MPEESNLGSYQQNGVVYQHVAVTYHDNENLTIITWRYRSIWLGQVLVGDARFPASHWELELPCHHVSLIHLDSSPEAPDNQETLCGIGGGNG